MDTNIPLKSNAAQDEIDAAKQEVVAAKQEVVAAERRVAAAEQGVAKAKEDYEKAKNDGDDVQRRMEGEKWETAQKGLNTAHRGLDTAQEGLDTAQKVQNALLKKAYLSPADANSLPTQKTSTPRSRSNPSRASIQSLIESLQQTEFNVMWCGADKNWQDEIQASQVSEMSCTDLLERSLDDTKIEQAVIDSTCELRDLDFRLLRTQGETEFQNGHLTKHFFKVDAAKSLDLSKCTINGPFFKKATQLASGEVVSAKTGKPDGTSVVVPMDLEIKSDKTESNNLAAIDFQVLDQAVERISVRMHNQGFLKMSFAFAVTGRSAWYMCAKRPEPLSKTTIWVDRIRHCDVGMLWMLITKLAGRHTGFFFTDDGIAICNALKKIEVTPWCCRVKALAKSQSFVYGVTVPEEYKSEGRTFFGVAVQPNDITYAVKIIRDGNAYEKERVALQKIAAKATSSGSSFYALGCTPNGDGEATKFEGHSSWETGCQFEATDEYWWDCGYQTNDAGGAIFMRRGEESARSGFSSSETLPKNVCSDLVNSLQLAHSAGILHCDLRRSNFMRFGSSWQVIDYSESTMIDCEKAYDLSAGSQVDCAGNRVKDMYTAKQPFWWKETDDYQMLIFNVLGNGEE